MFRLRAALCVAALLAVDNGAQAQTSFNTIYGFGDSYADTNRVGDPGGVFPPGVFPPNAPQRRFSSGLNFVDRLERNFGASDAVNYAFGGALTDGSNVGNASGPGFAQEIQLVQVLNQRFGPDDIVALSIGGNNANSILAGTANLSAGIEAYTLQSAQQVGAGVQELVRRGAQTITYFSVGAPELYPTRTVAIPPDRIANATIYLDQFLVNSQQQFAAIAAQGVRVNFFNFAVLQERILVGGEDARFGFDKVTGVPTDAQVPCPNLGCNPATASGFFYWDGVHLTEEAYFLAADFMTIQLGQNETIPVAADLAEIQARNFADTLSQRMEARRYGASSYDGTSTKDADPKRLSFKDEPEPRATTVSRCSSPAASAAASATTGRAKSASTIA